MPSRLGDATEAYVRNFAPLIRNEEAPCYFSRSENSWFLTMTRSKKLLLASKHSDRK